MLELGWNRQKLGNDEMIGLLLQEPRLGRRPVVRIGDEVYFGADIKVLEKLI
jgi:arsenate reductase-like glutaredoxin family protein